MLRIQVPKALVYKEKELTLHDINKQLFGAALFQEYAEGLNIQNSTGGRTVTKGAHFSKFMLIFLCIAVTRGGI